MSKIKLEGSLRIPAKIKTNEQFIQHIMTHSQYGMLAQMFIIDAITKAAEAVSETTDAEIAEAQKNSPFVNMEAWRNTARDIKSLLTEFYDHSRKG